MKEIILFLQMFQKRFCSPQGLRDCIPALLYPCFIVSLHHASLHPPRRGASRVLTDERGEYSRYLLRSMISVKPLR
jgi:hypothetical protein